MEFIIVSGLSGAGKSKVASFLEDMGFYCVDNLPAPLIPPLAQHCMANAGKFDRVALVIDIRGGHTFDSTFDALEQLEAMNCAYKILFVEASSETIIKRYKETRRSHPLSKDGLTLPQAVEVERAALAEVRRRAKYILDTTALSTAKLKGEIVRLFGEPGAMPDMGVSVVSFGFKYGIPIEADLVFDVRCLPNPFYIAELRDQNGLDEGIQNFLSGYRQSSELVKRLEDLLAFLLPLYVEEGKTALVIAVGCTGGRHRSVYVTHALAETIRQKGYRVKENHRDMTRA